MKREVLERVKDIIVVGTIGTVVILLFLWLGMSERSSVVIGLMAALPVAFLIEGRKRGRF